MAPPGSNEADTRAKLIDPVLHQARWVERVPEAERAARESASKAQAIEDAVYDLKAVNPAEKRVVDARTPVELLQAIADKGQEVDDALNRLKTLMQ
jgi:hypothetical protein